MATSQRLWWQRPQLRTDDQRAVGWLELFFDLVFVVIISRLAHQLAGDVSARRVVEFVVQFFGVFWVWNAFTYYTERFESGGLEDRLFTFLALLPVAGLAVFAEDGLRRHYPGFAGAYLAARGVNMLEWARSARHVPEFRPVAARFLAGFAVTAAVIVLSLGAGADTRLVLWTVAVVLDVATPSFTLRHQAALPPISRDKFPERFGLFTMIVLGESIIGVINGLSELSDEGGLGPSSAVTGGLGLGIGFALWWVYFDFVARRPPRPAIGSALAWVYLHLATVTTMTMAGVGISAAIADNAHGGLRASSQHLLASGVALALVIMGLLELTLHREQAEPTHPVMSPALKLAAGALLLGVGWAPIDWAATPLLAVLLVGLGVQGSYGAYVWFTRGPGSGARSAPA